MNEIELQKLIKDFGDYCENVVKHETPEEALAALIRTGVMDKDGNLILCRNDQWGGRKSAEQGEYLESVILGKKFRTYKTPEQLLFDFDDAAMLLGYESADEMLTNLDPERQLLRDRHISIKVYGGTMLTENGLYELITRHCCLILAKAREFADTVRIDRKRAKIELLEEIFSDPEMIISILRGCCGS